MLELLARIRRKAEPEYEVVHVCEYPPRLHDRVFGVHAVAEHSTWKRTTSSATSCFREQPSSHLGYTRKKSLLIVFAHVLRWRSSTLACRRKRTNGRGANRIAVLPFPKFFNCLENDCLSFQARSPVKTVFAKNARKSQYTRMLDAHDLHQTWYQSISRDISEGMVSWIACHVYESFCFQI